VIKACGILLFAAVCAAVGAQTYEIELDGEDPVFSVKSGGWTLDKTGVFNGNFKFSAPGPGDGSSVAVWTLDGLPSGSYAVEFYVDNGDYAQNARYIVESDAGTAIETRSQNFVGTGWHALGTYDFHHAGRISQTDEWTGGGTKVIADALRLTLQGTPETPTVNVVPPEITLVVDDLGALNPHSTTSDTYKLFNQSSPDICYAIIPFLTYSTAVLQDAEAKGIQTILHQPMQYIGQPDTNPADTVRLYIGMSDPAILSTLRANLASVDPYIVGANNHQGSRFSEYAQGMAIIVDELKLRKQFYLDSRTISDSVGYDIAQQRGLPTVERDLFIDGGTTQDTKDYILSLAMRALYDPNGAYVGIGHQRSATTPGIIAVVPEVQQMGVTFRRIAQQAAIVVETDFQPAGSTFAVEGPWTPDADDMINQECKDGNAMELSAAAPGTATFRPALLVGGFYRVFVGFAKGPNASPAVNVTVHDSVGDHSISLDQLTDPNRWHYVGTHPFHAGTDGSITLDNSLSTGQQVVRADAVKLVYDGPLLCDAWEVR